MTTFTSQDLLLSTSLAVYMATSLIFAAVRWGHKCEPFARHADYYYPAWKALVFCYLSNILMVPAIWMPQEADAVLHLRMLLLLASPFFCAILLFSYFGTILGSSGWRRPVYALIVPYVVITLFSTVLVFLPDTQIQGLFSQVFVSVVGTLALIFLGCFCLAIRMIVLELRHSLEEEYSNPNDFPRQFASGILWIPLVHLAVSWAGASLGTHVSLAICLLLLSAISVVFLIGILPPHRSADIRSLEDAMEAEVAPVEKETDALAEDRKDEIEKAVRHLVEEEKVYLDQHLTLTSLAHSIGFNRTYVSAVLNERLGGFFVYVNRCRLAHAARLQVERPDISVSELIDASGFSRTTYYKIRKQLEG